MNSNNLAKVIELAGKILDFIPPIYLVDLYTYILRFRRVARTTMRFSNLLHHYISSCVSLLIWINVCLCLRNFDFQNSSSGGSGSISLLAAMWIPIDSVAGDWVIISGSRLRSCSSQPHYLSRISSLRVVRFVCDTDLSRVIWCYCKGM